MEPTNIKITKFGDLKVYDRRGKTGKKSRPTRTLIFVFALSLFLCFVFRMWQLNSCLFLSLYTYFISFRESLPFFFLPCSLVGCSVSQTHLDTFFCFLTVQHLGSVLVNNQLDAQLFLT
jgi:hypothetical protein